MSQGINEFSRVAANLPDATPLRMEQNQVTRATSQQGATRAENMQANTETAKAFLNAARMHPGYTSGGADVEKALTTKMEKGLPLCADEVKKIVGQLNASQTKSMGEKLEHAGVLPEGTSAEFAKYLLNSFNSLKKEDGLRYAVRSFLLDHAIPSQAGKLTQIDSALVGYNGPPLADNEKQRIQQALIQYHDHEAESAQPYLKGLVLSSMASGLRAAAESQKEKAPEAVGENPPKNDKDLRAETAEHPELSKGMTALAATGISNLFAAANREEINLLMSLSAGARDVVLGEPNMLHVLMDSRNILDHDEREQLVGFLRDGYLPIDTENERKAILRDFLPSIVAAKLDVRLPNDLPQQLERPLAFNSNVQHSVKMMLEFEADFNIPLTQERVEAALIRARDTFAKENTPLLQELMQMAENPPEGINLSSALSNETLPLYLNMLLSGDALLEPFLNDSQPIDADFMQQAQRHNDNILSYSTLSKHPMGVDDANRLHENVMWLLLARRGVGASEYAGMFERGLARFGRISGELQTLCNTAYGQRNDFAQSSISGVQRVLGDSLANMASMLSPADRASLSLPEENAALQEVMSNVIGQEVSLKELSAGAHAFGTSLGLKLPDTDKAAVLERENQNLMNANVNIANAFLSRAKETQDRPDATSFQANAREVMVDMAKEAAGRSQTLNDTDLHNALQQLDRNIYIVNEFLSGIKDSGSDENALNFLPQQIASQLQVDDVKPDQLHFDRFRASASEMMLNMAKEAVTKNMTLDKDSLLTALQASIATDLNTMSSLMSEIDRLPKPSHLNEAQHAQQKNVMKDMLHIHPVTDLAVLSRLVDSAWGSRASVDKLCAAQGTAFAVTSGISALAINYSEVVARINEEGKGLSVDVGVPCYLDLVLRMEGMTEARAGQMKENITGDAGNRVAASYKYVLDSDKYSSQQKEKPEIAFAMMAHLQGKDSEAQPLRLTEKVLHLSEMPRNCLSYIVPSNSGLQNQLNQFDSKFSSVEWDLLERTGNALTSQMTSNADRLSSLLACNSSKLLEIANARQGDRSAPLTTDEVATALLGSPLSDTEKNNGANDGERLCNAFVSRYTARVTSFDPNVRASTIERSIRMGMYSLLPRAAMEEAAQPDGKLTLQNVPKESLELGSFGSYTGQNAYGLQEDFPRLHGGFITISDAHGKTQAHSPENLPKSGHVPATHPIFQGIIEGVRSIASSESQMLRTMHIFTQAGRKCIGMCEQAFPRNTEKSGMVLPMNYSVKKGEDGAIIVRMESLSKNPMNMVQQFSVNPDGSYRITELLVERRKVKA